MYGVDSTILMNAKVWEASGHVKNFVDPMVDCRACKMRYRADKIDPKKGCPNCGAKDLTEARLFNMMFKTHVGPVEDTASATYLRPETAQGMFVNFKNVIDSMHPKLPFGIAQVGKAFRNEITPGNFVFRIREFEQMEIEYFIREEEWQKSFEYWLGEMRRWLDFLGIRKMTKELEIPEKERAHYSKRTVDIDFDFPFGRGELYGLAYRTEFDLTNHAKASGIDLIYYDEDKKEKIVPHVIEPTFGVERTALALLIAGYHEEKDLASKQGRYEASKEGIRIVLKLPPRLAPITVAIFPLLANKPKLVDKARRIFHTLKSRFNVAWDERGNIGKRYYAQDEIGTPWCVTVDFQTMEDGTVTVRDRDTMRQERIAVEELVEYFVERLKTKD